jgi:hypothetical protein
MTSFLTRLLTLKVRKRRRYKAKDGIFVVYEQSLSKNQIDTISMGGLSFYYIDNGIRIDKGSYELALFSKDRMHIGKVPFRTVSDVETGEILFRNKKIKRQSVHFKDLSAPQRNQLKQVIQQYTYK